MSALPLFSTGLFYGTFVNAVGPPLQEEPAAWRYFDCKVSAFLRTDKYSGHF